MKAITIGMIRMIEGMRAKKIKDAEVVERLCKIYAIPEDRANDAILYYDNILVIPVNP